MVKKISLTVILLSLIFTGFTQNDSTKANKTFIISGYIDGYYRYDFENPKEQTNNYTSFTNTQNKFALGMASIKLEKTLKKLTSTIDVGFGKRAEEFSYNDQGFMTLIKQAYLSYSITEKLKITAGKWGTHVGYELLDAPLNRNYSMSYGFSYGPFFHTGVKAEYALTGKSSIMLGIANPTDYVTAESSSKVVIAQFSTKIFDDKTSVYVNYLGGNTGGNNNFSQFDLVLTNAISSKWAINYDGTIYSAKNSGTKGSWTSNAFYVNYDPTSVLGFTYRAEFFNDNKAISAEAFGTSVNSNTLSMNYKIKKITIIPEVRMEKARDKIYYSNDGNAVDQSVSINIAAIYKF